MEKAKELEEESPFSLDVVRDALKKVNREETKPIYDNSIQLFEDLGKMLVSIGTFQKKNEEAYNLLNKLSENPELFLSMVIKKLPASKVKKLVQQVLEILIILNEAKKLSDLDADSKITIGNKIIEIVTELKSTEKEKSE